MRNSHSIYLRLFDLDVELKSDSPKARSLIMASYSALCSATATHADLSYELSETEQGFMVRRLHAIDFIAWPELSAAELLFVLEKDLTIESQKLRPDLYFLHAAALRYRDMAFLLVSPSGGGKSTTCWGLVNHGCDYLSDELAPVQLQKLLVYPFPHALNLKAEPPAPYSPPQDTLRIATSLRIPTETFPVAVADSPVQLSAIFHIQYISAETIPSVLAISAAESASLLYANALNPLSHTGDGLDAAVKIARLSNSFRISCGDLELTVAAILSTLENADESRIEQNRGTA